VKKVGNIFVIFIVSGFWNWANWTFIFWGFLNALFIMPSILLKTNRSNIEIVASDRMLPTLREYFQIVMTFLLTTCAWIFFRSDSLQKAFFFLSQMFTKSFFDLPSKRPGSWILLFLMLFFILEWKGRRDDFAIQKIALKQNKVLRRSFYVILVLIIVLFTGKEQEFIYFQF